MLDCTYPLSSLPTPQLPASRAIDSKTHTLVPSLSRTSAISSS
jgi:hypothetical protein